MNEGVKHFSINDRESFNNCNFVCRVYDKPHLSSDSSQMALDLGIDISNRIRPIEPLHLDKSNLQTELIHKCLLATIATHFISSDPFHMKIGDIFEYVAQIMEIKRIYLYFMEPERTLRYCSDVCDSDKDLYLISDIKSSPFSGDSWVLERLSSGRDVILADRLELEESVREFFVEQDIGMMLLLPISVAQDVIGVIGFGEEHGYVLESLVYHFFKTLTDIFTSTLERQYLVHARLDAERQRLEAIETSERNLRLASIGALAAGITHEINQPLNALSFSVDGTIYCLKQNLQITQDEILQKLHFVSDQILRIDEIITGMRDLSHQDGKYTFSQIDINDIIDNSISLMEYKLSSRCVNAVKKLDNKLPKVNGNETQLQQVIVNLLNNSIQSFESVFRRDSIVSFATKVEEGCCVIEVCDNGPGIEPDVIDKIFDPFFSTKKDSEGMGFGLSIARNIISGMGGTIEAENREEGGAQFVITIPYNI